MPTLKQATRLLAQAFQTEPAKLDRVREALIHNGQLPPAKGRDIPLASPSRMALMLIGLGVFDPERIAELADLRRFKTTPGDMDEVTLCEGLGYTVKGLMEHSDIGVDMRLCLTTQGPPFGFLVARGEIVMQFGEPFTVTPPIHHTVTLDLMLLNDFCDLARATQPPYKVK